MSITSTSTSIFQHKTCNNDDCDLDRYENMLFNDKKYKDYLFVPKQKYKTPRPKDIHIINNITKNVPQCKWYDEIEKNYHYHLKRNYILNKFDDMVSHWHQGLPVKNTITCDEDIMANKGFLIFIESMTKCDFLF